MLGICEYFFATRQMQFLLLDFQFICMWGGALVAIVATVGRRILAKDPPGKPEQPATTTVNALGSSGGDEESAAGGSEQPKVRPMKALGYRTAPAGEAAGKAMLLGCVLWLVLGFVVLLDYYNGCQFTGVDNSCFYGDYFIFGGNPHPTLTSSASSSPHPHLILSQAGAQTPSCCSRAGG